MKKVLLNVKGMHCKSCSTLIKDALIETPGVKEAEVHLLNNKATVSYDETLTNEKVLIDAINKEGYTASISK
jgi:copper chaperone CopZ